MELCEKIYRHLMNLLDFFNNTENIFKNYVKNNILYKTDALIQRWQ